MKPRITDYTVLLLVLFAILIGGGATGKPLRFISFKLLWALSATLAWWIVLWIVTPKKEVLEAVVEGRAKAPLYGCAVALFGIVLFAWYGYLLVTVVLPLSVAGG